MLAAFMLGRNKIATEPTLGQLETLWNEKSWIYFLSTEQKEEEWSKKKHKIDIKRYTFWCSSRNDTRGEI
jgi:hypothetical protein